MVLFLKYGKLQSFYRQLSSVIKRLAEKFNAKLFFTRKCYKKQLNFQFQASTNQFLNINPLPPTIESNTKRIKMDLQHFDFIIFGTGLSESILSAILAESGYSVLQLDPADRYGSALQTFNYNDLCYKNRKKPLAELSKYSRDFNIDSTPKALLAGGLTQKCIVDFNLTPLVDFVLIPGSFLYKNKLYEVPVTEMKSIKTSLISFRQKPYVAKFFYDIRKYYQGGNITIKNTMKEQYKHAGINEESGRVIGHGIALFTDDSYLEMCPKITFDRIRLYIDSLTINAEDTSAFIYPAYGVSELCQAFVRKSAISGAIMRLNCEIFEIMTNLGNRSEKNEKSMAEEKDKTQKQDCTNNSENLNNELDEKFNKMEIQKTNDGKGSEKLKNESTEEPKKSEENRNSECKGERNPDIYKYKIHVKQKGTAEPEMIYAKSIISTPEYTKKHIGRRSEQKMIKVVRVTLIVKGNVAFLKNVSSAQVLFLSSGLNRESDVFTLILGHRERVAPKGYKVVLVSYRKESEDDQTIQKIISLFGNILDCFIREEEIPEVENKVKDDWYVVKGTDESMHVENGIEEVVEMVKVLKKEGFKIKTSFTTCSDE